MRKALKYSYIILGLLFFSCQQGNMYHPDREPRKKSWYEASPYGMAYIQRGTFVLGPTTDEVVDNKLPARRVSVESFWMDDTEITNNEYRQFVYWVRDLKARELLGETYEDFLITQGPNGEPLEEPKVNWDEKIDWKDPDYQMAMDELYMPEVERFKNRKVVDPRKLVYDYYWVDYKQAAKRSNSFNYKTQQYEGTVQNSDGEIVPVVNRSSFLMHESLPIYPDTLCWIRDFTYTYNEPYTEKYFSHYGFDDYPVVGVTWDQAKAFCNWRSNLTVTLAERSRETPAHDYRLPSEAEWEIASRGGLQNSLYPWGSYYTRSYEGCFFANFKPRRGNYVADSPTTTTTMGVGQFDPNPYGLFDMAGNVAEWTNTAFYEAGYDIVDDLNPELEYNAKPDDPKVMKRKVVRGGSWKDVSYFIRNSTRSFEYQDTAKSYIGFRCVRTSFRNDLQNR